jgi:two-component system, chemotaxis family, protein-glutamate methylesterase/glutaminase
MPIKVLVVDDSATVRQLISRMLSQDKDIEVVGTAADPYIARDKIVELKPDVLTLDIEMPRMDGITFLKILMEQNPLPVIVISSLTQEGSAIALEALSLGAIDVMAKPGSAFTIGDVGPQLIEKIKAAAIAKRQRKASVPTTPTTLPDPRATRPTTPVILPIGKITEKPPLTKRFNPKATLLLGASTGGTEALRDLLTKLPPEIPPTFIVQHIPPHFSRAFAERLNALCTFRVREAQEGDIGEPGLVLVAPGDYHMLLQWTGANYRVSLKKGPMVWHQRPAVDILFDSAVAAGAAPYATAAVLTGMGRDGADGLLKLKKNGSSTYAQSEESCVVYGMPKACCDIGAADKMVSLDQMPRVLQATYTRHVIS